MDDLWIRDALAAGVPADQLELHLQPVHDVASGALVGAETFVRWRHPEQGWVPIQRWHAEAARSGALVDMARTMLPVWADCTADRPGFLASFNFGAEQLLDHAFLAAALAIGDPSSRGLAVEVDHRDFLRAVEDTVTDPDTARVGDLDERLAALEAGGFAIWLDDFGETSLDEAAAFHPSVDVVKFDRSLLGADATWLGELVRRLHDHGKTVLLEGIETDEHGRFAVRAGVDWAQGFRYAPPLPAEAFAAHGDAAPAAAAGG